VTDPAPVGACVCTLCVPNFMPRRPFDDFRSVRVGFVVDRVAL
jgi:hypothetical protein